MKKLLSAILVAIFVLLLIFPQPALAQQPGQQRTGNIGGLVEDREKQDDQNRNVAAEINSDRPITQAEVKLNDDLVKQVKAAFLPPGWELKKEKDRVIVSGPPLFALNILFEFPKSFGAALDKFLKKELEFSFGFGEIKYGTFKFMSKHTAPLKVVSPKEAAQIPDTIRPGQPFSITPNEGYTKGTWNVFANNRKADENRLPWYNIPSMPPGPKYETVFRFDDYGYRLFRLAWAMAYERYKEELIDALSREDQKISAIRKTLLEIREIVQAPGRAHRQPPYLSKVNEAITRIEAFFANPEYGNFNARLQLDNLNRVKEDLRELLSDLRQQILGKDGFDPEKDKEKTQALEQALQEIDKLLQKLSEPLTTSTSFKVLLEEELKKTDEVYEKYKTRTQPESKQNDVLLNQTLQGVEKFIQEYEQDTTQNTPGNTPSTKTFYFPKSMFSISPNTKIEFQYLNQFGEKLVDGPADTKILPPVPDEANLAPPYLINCTPKLFQGDALCVCGFFPNFFSQAQLLLDGKPLGPPLSASTDILTFLPENLAPGKHVITWNLPIFDTLSDPEPKRVNPSAQEKVEFVVLGVEARIDRDKLFVGDGGTDMEMRITGTEERLPIELENTTKTIIELEGGDKQVVMTSGGSNNMFKKHVTGKQRGAFNINYKLAVPPCPCNPSETFKDRRLTDKVSDEKAPEDKNDEGRENCELLMMEYNTLSIEYGKLKSDFQRVYDYCSRQDDGTPEGKRIWAQCMLIQKIFNQKYLDRMDELRDKMLDLLQRYRECREKNK